MNFMMNTCVMELTEETLAAVSGGYMTEEQVYYDVPDHIAKDILYWAYHSAHVCASREKAKQHVQNLILPGAVKKFPDALRMIEDMVNKNFDALGRT